MARRSLLAATSLLTALGVGCASKPAPETPAAPRPGGSGSLEVSVTGFESEEGQVLIALFLDESGWPDDEGQAHAALVLPIEDRSAVARFDDVPAGSFAVSVFHDKDLDRELDSGLFGIPTEAYGFSRDARDTFGPPSFDDARLEVGADDDLAITIRVE